MSLLIIKVRYGIRHHHSRSAWRTAFRWGRHCSVKHSAAQHTQHAHNTQFPKALLYCLWPQ